MRIAITGAQGVGKTTLAKQISEVYPEIKILPEAARLALDLGYKLDQDADMETELWIMAKQIELERHEGSWVADRCFIDLSIYLHELFAEKTEYVFLIKLADTIADRQIEKYDLILYLPSGEFPIPDDGVRNLDQSFQQSIDRNIRNWLDHKKLAYHMIRGNREERLEHVKGLINNHTLARKNDI